MAEDKTKKLNFLDGIVLTIVSFSAGILFNHAINYFTTVQDGYVIPRKAEVNLHTASCVASK